MIQNSEHYQNGAAFGAAQARVYGVRVAASAALVEARAAMARGEIERAAGMLDATLTACLTARAAGRI